MADDPAAARRACHVNAKGGREYSACQTRYRPMHAIQNLDHALFLLVNAGATTPRWWIDLAVFVANDPARDKPRPSGRGRIARTA